MSQALAQFNTRFQREQTSINRVKDFFEMALQSTHSPNCLKEEITSDINAGFSFSELVKRWDQTIDKYAHFFE